MVTPVLGSSLPTNPALLPVNQMLPTLSSVSPCGAVWGDLREYSRIAPVFGSIRPSLLANCPLHQIAPSLVASGSCGREPMVGTFHSLIVACVGPGNVGRDRSRPLGKVFRQIGGNGRPVLGRNGRAHVLHHVLEHVPAGRRCSRRGPG